jgi:amidase
MSQDVTMLPAGTLAARIAARQLSPVEVIDAFLERIADLDPQLSAFVTCPAEQVRAEARAAERQVGSGAPLGALHGVPVGIKDVLPVAGMRFTYGSRRFADHVADADALLVARLRAAGAIVIGKTNTPEFAAYMNTTNKIAGTTVSPWNVERSSGGSSGGSAVAVATGMAALAIGTDHGGSVRLPAAFNNLLGLRSTPGLVPVLPNPWVYDEFDVHGPLARTVDDLDLVLSVLSGPDPRVPISGRRHRRGGYLEGAGLAGMRVAWTPDLGGLFALDDDVRSVTEAAARRLGELGAHVREHAPALEDAVAAIRPLRVMRSLIEHGERLDRLDELDNVLLRGFLETASTSPAQVVAEGQAARSRAWQRNAGFFDDIDLLALPTTQVASFGKDELSPQTVAGKPVEDALGTVTSTYAISIMGWPALSVPCGMTDEGMPVGLQLVAPHGEEARLLRAARTLEVAHPWADERPPVLAAPTGR